MDRKRETRTGRPHPRTIRARRPSARERRGKQWSGWKPAASRSPRRRRSFSTSSGLPRTMQSSSSSVNPRLACSAGCAGRREFRPGFGRSLPRPSGEDASARIEGGPVATVPVAEGLVPREVLGAAAAVAGPTSPSPPPMATGEPETPASTQNWQRELRRRMGLGPTARARTGMAYRLMAPPDRPVGVVRGVAMAEEHPVSRSSRRNVPVASPGRARRRWKSH
jgi:hypothetical protein